MKMNEKLDILLNRRRIKRVEFAESIGITYRAFAYYMSDTRKPRKGILEKIAKELDVTPEFLADDSIDMELTLEERFIKRITDRGNDPTAAMRFLAQSRGLLAGNSLSEEDKASLMSCLTEIYEDSLKKGKK